MDGSVLVAYASKYGATKEIAEAVGDVIRRAGLPVEVASVDGIGDPSRYGAVVLGGALYVGKWPKGATAFLRTHEASLANRPVWLFSSGPTGQGDPLELVDGRPLPADVQPYADRIRPRAVAVFHGNIDPDRVNFIEKWAIKRVVKKPFGDYRNWDAIAAWATEIAETLKSSEVKH